MKKIMIEIPDNEIPEKQTIITCDIHFIDGKVCECSFPFENVNENKLENKKTGNWIPVSERLPEFGQDVLLSLRSLDIKTGFRAETEPYFYCHGIDGCYIEPQNVLAWMPLPQPYKAESEEQLMISEVYKSVYQQGYDDAKRDFRKQSKIDILDKIIAEIEDTGAYEQEVNGKTEFVKGITFCLSIIDKYKAEREE